jgi:hypothetical protein
MDAERVVAREVEAALVVAEREPRRRVVVPDAGLPDAAVFAPTYITSGFDGCGAAASIRPAAKPRPTFGASIGDGPKGNQFVVVRDEMIVIAASGPAGAADMR